MDAVSLYQSGIRNVAAVMSSSLTPEQARLLKHLFGGAMRQAGIIAAAGVYALEHHVERLAEDHANAKLLAAGLATVPGITLVHGEPETKSVVDHLMKSAKIQADDVARIALDAAANGRLFILPHRDGRGLWLFKRLAPERFYRMIPKLMALRASRR